MDLNFALFPKPKSSYSSPSLYNQIIYIPLAPIKKYKSAFSIHKDYGKESSHIPCLYLKTDFPSTKIMLYFHANAEDIGQAKKLLSYLRELLGYNIIALEYPGYGIYSGSCSADRIIEDGINVYDYLTTKLGCKEENIIVFGRSIGTGPAIHIAAFKNPGALVSMSGYTSIKTVVRQLFGKFFQYIVKERFFNVDLIKYVTCPVFIMHGLKDTLIPYTESQELFKSCKDIPCYLHLPPDMTHTIFDVVNDFTIPLKNFLANFNKEDESENELVTIPNELFVIPASFS